MNTYYKILTSPSTCKRNLFLKYVFLHETYLLSTEPPHTLFKQSLSFAKIFFSTTPRNYNKDLSLWILLTAPQPILSFPWHFNYYKNFLRNYPVCGRRSGGFVTGELRYIELPSTSVFILVFTQHYQFKISQS